MKTSFLIALLCSCIAAGTLHGQGPVPGPPVQLDLGIGGGVSMPVGTLNNADNTGYHTGIKGRIRGITRLNLVGSLAYNRLPNKVGGESDVFWTAGGGIEYPVPSTMVEPYFGADVLYNSLSNSAAGAQAKTRFGGALGAGVSFSLPAFGTIDASVKYQLLNLVGKDTGEETVSQIAANVSLMFNVM